MQTCTHLLDAVLHARQPGHTHYTHTHTSASGTSWGTRLFTGFHGDGVYAMAGINAARAEAHANANGGAGGGGAAGGGSAGGVVGGGADPSGTAEV